VAKRAREPRWLSRLVIDAIHADQLQAHGGSPGRRDENALESALARPLQKWEYGRERDPAAPAAAYGFGLIRNHPYQDGNKRVGFLAIATFLGINGHELHATDEDVVTTMFALASGDLSEDGLARSIRTWMTRRAGPSRRR
jgi:death on curing protein